MNAVHGVLININEDAMNSYDILVSNFYREVILFYIIHLNIFSRSICIDNCYK